MPESRAPARMRHSWEARCRLVRLMLDGASPAAAAVVCGASRATAHPARLSVEAEAQIVELWSHDISWGSRNQACPQLSSVPESFSTRFV